MKDIKLSIILPVYSETQSVADTVEQLIKGINKEDFFKIIIVISPLSTRISFSMCEDLSKKYDFIKLYIQKNNPGLGWAIREGFTIMSGTHVLMMGSDGETDPKVVPDMIERIRKTGCDIVTANRWITGGGFSSRY